MMSKFAHFQNDTIETPIASLIDIVFLLIIFFVVTSAIEKDTLDNTIKLAESQFINPVSRKDPRTITVNVKKINETESEINIGGVPLALTTLKSVLKDTADKYGADVPVVIRASSDLHFVTTNLIMESIVSSGLHRIKLSSKDIGKH